MCPARVVEGVPAPMLAAVSGLAGARLAVIPHPGTARLRAPTADLGPAATTVASPDDALRITENDHRFLPTRRRHRRDIGYLQPPAGDGPDPRQAAEVAVGRLGFGPHRTAVLIADDAPHAPLSCDERRAYSWAATAAIRL